MNGLILLSVIWFSIGAAGLCARRNATAVLLAAGLMGQGVIVLAIVFGRLHGNDGGRNLALAALGMIAAVQLGGLLPGCAPRREGEWTGAGDSDVGVK